MCEVMCSCVCVCLCVCALVVVRTATFEPRQLAVLLERDVMRCACALPPCGLVSVSATRVEQIKRRLTDQITLPIVIQHVEIDLADNSTIRAAVDQIKGMNIMV